MSKHSKKQLRSKENTQSSLQAIPPERSETSAQIATPSDKADSRDQFVATGNFIKDYAELCARLGIDRAPSIVPRGRRLGTPMVASTDVHPNKDQAGKGKEKKLQPPPSVFEKEKDRDKRRMGASPSGREDSEVKDTEVQNTSEWKTFSTRDTWACLKPAIQIESDSVLPEGSKKQHDVEHVEVVYEIYVTGWKVDSQMMEVFRSVWPSLEKLHTVTLWNVGLTSETVELLADKLQLISSLKTLNLDGNAQNAEQNFHLLISPKNPNNLQRLSLRHCEINDRGAELIAESLSNFTMERFSSNSKLVSLNLASNKISDRGAACLAKALRFNRTLLMLTLSDNLIGDRGACALAVTLSKFPLEHVELCERRRIQAKRREALAAAAPLHLPSKRGTLMMTGGRSTSMSKAPEKSRKKQEVQESGGKKGKGEKDRGLQSAQRSSSKDEKSNGQDHSGKKAQATPAAAGGKTTNTKGGNRDNKKTSVHTPVPAEAIEAQKEDKGPMPPFLDDLTSENDPDRLFLPWNLELGRPVLVETREDAEKFISPYDIIVKGNFTLANLNLSRNRIGKLGMEMLLTAMKYQSAVLQSMPNALVNYSASGSSFDMQLLVTGVLRLPLNGNLLPSSDLTYRELVEHMGQKDIFVQLLAKKQQGNLLQVGAGGTATSMSFVQMPELSTPSLTPIVAADERLN